MQDEVGAGTTVVVVAVVVGGGGGAYVLLGSVQVVVKVDGGGVTMAELEDDGGSDVTGFGGAHGLVVSNSFAT